MTPPRSPAAKRRLRSEPLLIARLLSESIFFRALRPDKTRCSYCRAGREEKRKHVRGMSTQIVFAFHLVGFLSIQLLICISAGVCANSWHVSLCVRCQSTETKTAWCVKSCRRNAQTPIRRGLCRQTRTEMNVRNGSTVRRLSALWVSNGLGLKGEKQGDKLSQQISTDLKFPR